MSVKCECAAAGWCERRQLALPKSMFAACQAGRLEVVDTMLASIKAKKEELQNKAAEAAKAAAANLTQAPKEKRKKTGYGDRLAAIIQRETGEQTTCTGCQNEIGTLNWMKRQDVLADLDGLVTRIRLRASTKARAWWQRWGCTLAPGIAEATIRGWVMESISEQVRKSGIRIITSFGPRREERQLQCLQSWQRLGCDVVAVQTANEAEHVSKAFPGVEMVITDKVGDVFGKPNHVRISALIDQCRQSPGLLLNSDIEIAGTVDELIEHWPHEKSEFRICVRWDKNPETGEMHLQKCGIDGFLVTPEIAAKVPDYGFAIGTPAWDYWLPYHCVARLKKRLITHKSQNYIHVMHPQAWDKSEITTGLRIIQRNYHLNRMVIHRWILNATKRN